MRVLITGGAGFIGSEIVHTLTSAGHQTVVFDALLSSVHGAAVDPADCDAERIIADVRDREAVDRALRGIDAVCHQAAMVGLGNDFADAPEYVGCNDLGTAVLLAAMAEAGVRSLVLAGSMVVYGEGRYDCPRHGTVRPGPRTVADLDAGRFEPHCPCCGAELAPGLVAEDAPTDPRSVYAATKLTQEHLTAAWARATGGSAVSLRYHNVYGPGMPRDTPYAGVASFFRSALARGEAPRSLRMAASGGILSMYGMWRPRTYWRWKPSKETGRAVLLFTTRGVGIPAPSARWPRHWLRHMVALLRRSPANTGSVMYAMSLRTHDDCETSWAGSRRKGSPGEWRSLRRPRCGGCAQTPEGSEHIAVCG